MKFIKLVEQRKKEQRLNNIKELRQDINSEWVKTKINNHLERFSGIFTYEDIQNEILHSDIVASLFAKDPSKQNISEKMVEELLKIKKLPASGKNCIRFNQAGEIVSTSAPSHTKSADFIVNDAYITQKYTMETGGAQDNQYDDVVSFLTCGSQQYKVGALVDGLYWENGKRQELINYFKDNPNVVILSMDNLL
jgi:hypothetical protein